MIKVVDKFGVEIFPGSAVAIATNSGIYLGRVVMFNTYQYSNGKISLSSVQVQLTTGRKQSYDQPDKRMVCLDNVIDTLRMFNL